MNMDISLLFIKDLPENAEIKTEVSSNSMIPVFKKRDKIIIKKIDFTHIHTGDIIAFSISEPPFFIVHRVSKVLNDSNFEKYFLTQGDLKREEDPWIVTKYNFLGKVVGIINI